MEAQRAAEELRLMRQQTELLRQQTEALRKRNAAAVGVPEPTSGIGLAIPPLRVPPAIPPTDGDNTFTNEMLNCRGWRNFPAEVRLFYMIGILEGFQFGMTSGATAGLPNGLPVEKLQAEAQNWIGKIFLTNGERVAAMDAFCAPSENSAIEVVFAVQVAAMKANGFTANQIEAMTVILRRQASEAAK
jgi:hypothetical protein